MNEIMVGIKSLGATSIILCLGIVITGSITATCTYYDGYNPDYGNNGVGNNAWIISDGDKFKYEEGTWAGHCYENNLPVRLAWGIIVVSLLTVMGTVTLVAIRW